MPTKVRMMPHRTMTSAAVAWRPWEVSFGAEFVELPAELASWDFASECTVRASAVIDEQVLLESTGLPSIEDIELVAQVECASTYVRTTESVALERRDTAEYSVSVRLAPGCYSSQIALSLHLVLGRDLQSANNTAVAARRGSRLGSSEVTKVQLGATSSRFPTEALAFSGVLPPSAPWILNVAYDDLNDSFLGAARLLVNTNHPAGRVALDSTHANAPLVRSVLMVDVTRSLILQVAAKERAGFDLSREFDSNSIGYVVDSLCRTEMKGNLDSVIRMLGTDPSEFESRLQASFGYLQLSERDA